ncbi:MAG: hypothetical protein JW797_19905 [Bradymonadales bacterium]|nr:hypothetical protein [Bradymonadales bacterium]
MATSEMTGKPPPPLRQDLVLQEQTHRGEPYVVVKDPLTSRFFRLPSLAFRVASRFDASATPEQLAEQVATEERCAMGAAEVERFADRMESLGLLDQQLTSLEIEARQRASTRQQRSIFYLKWGLVDPDRMLARLLVLLRPLFSRPAAVLTAGLVAGSLILYLARPEIVAGALWQATHGGGLIWLYAATALTLTLHELSHGLVSKRHGAEVHEMGFMLLYFMPCAYTDISNAYLVPRKRDRIAITLAGSVCDLAVWALASIALLLLRPGPTGTQILGALMLTTGYRSVALNLNPLIKLDGYYVLVDWLEMPNLRQRSQEAIRWRIGRWLGRKEQQVGETVRDRRVLESYGWLSSLYVVALLSLTVWWLDGWLVRWSGPAGRLAYLPLALLIALVWMARRKRRRMVRFSATENEDRSAAKTLLEATGVNRGESGEDRSPAAALQSTTDAVGGLERCEPLDLDQGEDR